MSATMPCREWRGDPVLCLFTSLCLLAMLFCAGSVTGLPEEAETVLIGNLELSDSPVGSVGVVRISFTVEVVNAPIEYYMLKIFDVGSGESDFDDVTLLAERWVKVDGVDPIERDAIWIDTPPTRMQWVEIEMPDPLPPNSGHLLYAIEYQARQLPGGEAFVTPHLELEYGDPQTYFSTDEGTSWSPFTVEELTCLCDPTCEDNGSTNLRINVRPC